MADQTNYYDRPYDLVLAAWDKMENRANQSFSTAHDVMATLSNYHIDVGSVVAPTAPVIDISLPQMDAPTASVVDPARLNDLTVAVENIPDYAEPTWEDGSAWVTPIDDITVPTFTPTVQITLPATPAPIDRSGKPSRPDYSFDALPLFQGVRPTFNTLPPDAVLHWANGTYTTQLLDSLSSRVQAMLMGGTGLPPAIEAALFERARGRESLAALEAINTAFDTFAGRGFTMPPGMLVAQINTATQENQLKTGAINRDILVQASQMEIENLRQAIQTGLTLESALMNLFQAMQSLTLDAAKAQQNAEISLYNAAVTVFNAYQNAYQTDASVFKEQTAAVLDTIRAKLDTWNKELDGWIKDIDAQKISTIDIYEAMLRGEAIKGQLIGTEVQAFTAGLDGIKTRTNIKQINIESRLKALSVSTEKYTAQAQSARSKIESTSQIATANLNAMANVLSSETGRFQAETGFNSTKAELSLKGQEAQTRLYMAEFEILVREFDQAQARLIEQAKIVQGSIEAAGQMAAQLAAGTTAAQHASASMSGNAGISSSYGYSETHSYDETTL